MQMKPKSCDLLLLTNKVLPQSVAHWHNNAIESRAPF